MAKIVMVRSSSELVRGGYVGYGWNKVNFSEYDNETDLITNGFKDFDYGRLKKQIMLYHSIKIGDIIIVPVSGAIAVGKATNEKIYIEKPPLPLSSNRIKVDFYKDKDGNVLYVPRVNLPTNFQRRLKIRTSIADLEGFRKEVEANIESLEKNEIFLFSDDVQNKQEELKQRFIEGLEKRLRSEKDLGIQAGGYGLENLIREIFDAKGYDAHIPAKNKRHGVEDVDIIATKNGEFGAKGEGYLIQAKHHRGETGHKGLEQLIHYDINDNDYIYRKVLVTTAKVNDALKDEAKINDIIIIEGQELAEWIYENLDFLSLNSKLRLGVSQVPTLI